MTKVSSFEGTEIKSTWDRSRPTLTSGYTACGKAASTRSCWTLRTFCEGRVHHPAASSDQRRGLGRCVLPSTVWVLVFTATSGHPQTSLRFPPRGLLLKASRVKEVPAPAPGRSHRGRWMLTGSRPRLEAAALGRFLCRVIEISAIFYNPRDDSEGSSITG